MNDLHQLVNELANAIGRTIERFEERHDLAQDGTATLQALLSCLIATLAELVPTDRERSLATIHATLDDLVLDLAARAGGPVLRVPA